MALVLVSTTVLYTISLNFSHLQYLPQLNPVLNPKPYQDYETETTSEHKPYRSLLHFLLDHLEGHIP
jgi:hypothetical protein